MNNEELYNRARNQDELYVLFALEELGFFVTQSTPEEDWQHVDLKIASIGDVANNIEFLLGKNIDVKRNSPTNASSKSFSLTIINTLGDAYPFTKTEFFAFIDDINNQVYIIRKSTVEQYITDNNIKIYDGKGPSKYVLLNKEDIKNLSSVILKPSYELYKYL